MREKKKNKEKQMREYIMRKRQVGRQGINKTVEKEMKIQKERCGARKDDLEGRGETRKEKMEQEADQEIQEKNN